MEGATSQPLIMICYSSAISNPGYLELPVILNLRPRLEHLLHCNIVLFSQMSQTLDISKKISPFLTPNISNQHLKKEKHLLILVTRSLNSSKSLRK